jgi:hypothetical protein
MPVGTPARPVGFGPGMANMNNLMALDNIRRSLGLTQ